MIQAKLKYRNDPFKAIDGLTRTLRKRATIRAVQAALPPVVQAVEEGAGQSRRYGYLQESIGKKVKGYRNGVAAIIGPKSKFKRRKGVRTRGKNKGQPIWHRPALYAHLVEKGTKRSKARPFLNPALNRTKQKYFADVTANLAVEIAVELAKKGG